MDIHVRSRSLLWAVPILVAVLVSSVNAQGLFGGLPGLPSLGGYLGGSSGCGEKVCPSSNLEAYVGWMDDHDGTTINVDATRQVDLISSVKHHFSNRGLGLGLGDTICLSDRLSFIASSWYLVPSKTESREEYFAPGVGVAERTWDINPYWWYVDGVFALNGPAGLTLLAGLRYDYYTVRFKNPFNDGGAGGFPSDTADATSVGWIPLLGTQYVLSSSAGNLVVRAVGVPTLLGNIKYKETGAGTDRVEASGTYNNGWFLEVFAEFSKSFGPGAVGVFGRWNGAQGNANVHFDVDPVFPVEQRYKLTVHRNSWTFGGSFSLNFNLPM